MRTKPKISWLEIFWPRPLGYEVIITLAQRLVSDPSLGRMIIQTYASRDGVRFCLGVSSHKALVVTQMLQDLVPSVNVVWLPQDEDTAASAFGSATRPYLTRAVRLSLSQSSQLLDTTQHERLVHGLLGALGHLRPSEVVVLQLVLTARRAPSAVPHQPWWDVLLNGHAPHVSESTVRRRRHNHHLVKLQFRIGVMAQTPAAARHKIMAIAGVLSSVETSYAKFRITPENPHRLTNATTNWYGASFLAASELAMLTAWPVGEHELPGMASLSPKLLAPPIWLSTSSRQLERVFAISNAPSQTDVKLSIPPKDSLLHTVLLGPTGVGKSTAMLCLITADINAGRGVLVIDPKTDLVTSVMERIPFHRRGDVVLLDPQAPNPVGLNPLASRLARHNPDVAADSLLATFKAIFADSWGVRTEEVLTASLLTLARARRFNPDVATLVAIPRLLTNSGFRRRITSRLNDPLGVSSFWAKYESWSQAQQTQVIQPVLNKLQQFVIRPHMRAVLGQTVPRFELEELFSQRKIVLLRLNKGVLGAESARLLGSLVMGQLWPLILSRATQPETRRTLTNIYIDEVHDFLAGIPGDLADALSQSRSLGVAFTMAHQYLSQLTPQMRRALDANARNKICFELSSADSKDMAAHTAELSSQDFTSLPRFGIYTSLMNQGRKTGWISGTTLPPPRPCSDEMSLAAKSSAKYGIPANKTEADLQHLLHGQPHPSPTNNHSESTDQTPPAVANTWQFGRSTNQNANYGSEEAADQSLDQSQQ